MADFKVDYAELDALKSNLASAMNAVDALKDFGDVSTDDMGNSGVASATHNFSLLIGQGLGALAIAMQGAGEYVSKVKWSTREVDGKLESVITGGTLLGDDGRVMHGGQLTLNNNLGDRPLSSDDVARGGLQSLAQGQQGLASR